MRRLLAFIFLLLLIATTNSATVPGAQLKLGQISFPTSTKSPTAAAHFVMGLKYLHNFMYPLALREFKLAQQSDPSFALSYWGMAMCYKWSLWSYENKKKGQQVLADFYKLKHVTMSPLEHGLMNAIEIIYGPGSQIANEKKYMEAMQQLYQRYPNNPDVASFYALALIGYANDTPYKKSQALLQDARNVLQRFFKSNPGHPGIIHYYMHANDLPNTAYPSTSLSVIDKACKYMSDSAHVMHMPAHLYTDLGWWADAARANKFSIRAGHHLCQFLEKEKINLHTVDSIELAKYDPLKKANFPWSEKEKLACDSDNIYHSLEWLQYEYLQMGQFHKAQQLLNEMNHVAAIEKQPEYNFWAERMNARQILYTQHFTPVTALPQPLIEISHDKNLAAYSECGMLLADGLRALHYQQMDLLPIIHARFEKIISLVPDDSYKQACRLNEVEVLAMKSVMLDKNSHKSTDMLDQSLALQSKLQSSIHTFSVPFVPAQELYGEVMLQDPLPKNLQKAKKSYEDELQVNPNRTQAILGLARVEAKLGNVAKAKYWYQKLLKQYQHADSLLEVSEARKYLAKSG